MIPGWIADWGGRLFVRGGLFIGCFVCLFAQYKLSPVDSRSDTVLFFEQFDEMRGVGEVAGQTDFGNGAAG